jgi:hypothetical protein
MSEFIIGLLLGFTVVLGICGFIALLIVWLLER